MILLALVKEWRARATELERYAPAAANAFRDAAKELEEALGTTTDAVTLSQASEIGGYSIDALQRMVAQGRIKNVGRKGRPRIARAAVPIKPGYADLSAQSARRTFSPTAVVASAIARG